MSVQQEEIETSKMSDKELIAYLMKKNAQLEQKMLLLFKSGINLLTRFGKTNPINFDKI